MDDSDDIYEFCGFNSSASNFITKFIYLEKDGIATPCAEFTFVAVDSFIFLFSVVLGFFHIKNSARIPSTRIRLILVYKLLTSLITSISLITSLILSVVSARFRLPSVILIEYGLTSVVWIVYAIVWIQTLHYNAWTRPFGMSVAYGFASKTLIVIFVNRCVNFGFTDYRSFFIFILLVLHLVNYVFCVIEFIFSKRYQNLNCFFDSSFVNNEIDTDEADEGANLFSKFFFCWTNDLVKRGYRGEIRQVEDLYKLPPSLRISRVEREFFEAAPTEFTDARPFSFSHALFRAYGRGYLLLGVMSFVSDCLKFTGPILLHLLIDSLDRNSTKHGFIYATLMLASTFFSAVTACSYNFYVRKVSLKVRCALMTAVYDKLLQIPTSRLSKFSTGQLINIMSTDVDRIVDFCTSFHAVWSMPMNLLIALYLLYREIGLAFIAGLLAALVTIPINKCIATKIGTMSAKMMNYKDLRIRIVTETIHAIQIVKLNNWEPFFADKIQKIRAKELKYLRARKYLDAVCVYLWASAPIIITIAILITYTLMLGEQLTTAKVFTSLALVNILIVPLNAFPWVLNSLIEAIVSKRRLNNFFSIESMDLFAIYGLVDAPHRLLQVDGARFSWSNSNCVIGSINLHADRGTLIGVVGPVGSGKSTLLLGLLGETANVAKKSIRVRQSAVCDGIAYVGHCCWLQRGTVRENILSGNVMRDEFYREVLRATALDHDFEVMPNKDDYMIGDNGMTLSGGQRARLALARALYHDSDVVLLDDPFASLDASVAEFVYENCIEGLLRKRGKTVILCTHHIRYLRNADHVICLDSDGVVRSEGNPSDVLSLVSNQSISVSADKVDSELAPFDNAEPVAFAPIEEESKKEGVVQLDVYWFYFGAIGGMLSAFIFASIFVMQVTKNGSDVWLSRWALNTSSITRSTTDWNQLVDQRESDTTNTLEYNRTSFFLTVYVCMALSNTVFTLIRAFLFAYGGVVAAEKLQRRLLHRVLSSTIAWWNETPWGRIVNRLCADVYTVDDSLPFQLNICLASLFNLFGALVITLVAMPFLTPLIVILLVLYYFIQRYYRFANCEVKRLTTLTLSPLYSHINDTVMGLVTIRAHRLVEQFMGVLRDRLDRNLRAQFTALAASQWLSVRLQLLGVVMVSAVSYTGVSETLYLSMEPGIIALAMTYALSLTNTLSSLLCSFIDTEKELVSVERIADYIVNVPEEATNADIENLDKFLFCRAIKGQIDFTSVSLRYGAGKPLALKNVTFHVEAGQRVGIIGRTGAGKSSIFQALLRANPIETGKIYIDGGAMDIMKMDPRAVRSMFGFVSQRPFVFSGTIRENFVVNNTNQLDDAVILSVISKAGLVGWLERSGGLDAEVTEDGRNFSHGEKQIIGVCRLILSRPKIVLIDEATAHMDEAKHLAMINLIQNQLPDTTILSIVHRTIGLERFDWIIEMSDGAVYRQGRPAIFESAVH